MHLWCRTDVVAAAPRRAPRVGEAPGVGGEARAVAAGQEAEPGVAAVAVRDALGGEGNAIDKVKSQLIFQLSVVYC